jgi:hypothetical protein
MKNKLMIVFAIGLLGNAFNGYASADPRRGSGFRSLPGTQEEEADLSEMMGELTVSQVVVQGALVNTAHEVLRDIERAGENPSMENQLVGAIQSFQNVIARYREVFSEDDPRNHRMMIYQRILARISLVRDLIKIDEDFENSGGATPDLTEDQMNDLISGLQAIRDDQDFLVLMSSEEMKRGFLDTILFLLESYESKFPPITDED